ncbi:MAG TPA: hypothetical protein VKB58_16110 [Terriglobales bacterium]|jgi:hypothetical protein|nr:hypothetical protein [Terriglobales bacterium]
MADNQEVTTPKSNEEEEDSNVARSRPAIYVDAFLVEGAEDAFRITFGEGTAGHRERIRFAMVMPTDDVRALVKSLTSVLGKVDKDIAEAAKKPKANGA